MYFSPRDPQVPIIDFGLAHRRANIWASMGIGKSSASIYLYDALRMFGEVKRAVVFAPKRVARGTWPGEIKKFRETFGHLKIAAAVGTPEERRAAVMSKPDILCVNYEQAEWLIDGYGRDWPFDMVLADEATRLKGLRIAELVSSTGKEFLRGQGSVRAKKLSEVAHRYAHHWYNLTGSPAPNGLQDLWGQCWFIDRGHKLGSTFKAFTDKWFRSVQNADGYHQLEPLRYADPEIKREIRDYTITVDIRDYFPIDKPFEHVVKVPLPPSARRVYDEMEKNLFAELASGDAQAIIRAFAAGGKVQKCLQIGNGAVFDDEKKWHRVHDAKLEALESIVAETNGEPLLIRYTHTPDRDRILKAFPRFRILDNKQQTEDDWNAGRIPGLLAHAASAGHGLNLQDGGRILVDFCTDYNLEHDEQIIERVGPARQFQSGHPRPVWRYRLIAEDTIEEHSAYPRIESKASVQDSLKDAMKRRRSL